ncbi:uncharacterized protein LOC105696194 [Orussus abietinus]|uniref:uncharacterized protein LOC105696194 n=1 Tax=Orussus abietinus TaxID=222816 RepID=UPI00062649D4|nr:uncharacterized protein LOC105696194 [Orussus abietinus]
MPDGKKQNLKDPGSPWQHRAYEKHRARVKLATSTVDVDPPEERPHVFNNAKKAQLEKERQAEIIRENFILLKKLHEIMYGRSKESRLLQKKSKCIKAR